MEYIAPDDSSFLAEFLAAKADADRAQSRLNKAQNQLIYWMEANRRKTIKTWVGEEQTAQITYTQSTTYKVDERALRRALRAKVFDKYTVKKLDRKALEEAMSRGEVDPTKVAPYVSEHKNKPFLKFTLKEQENSDA